MAWQLENVWIREEDTICSDDEEAGRGSGLDTGTGSVGEKRSTLDLGIVIRQNPGRGNDLDTARGRDLDLGSGSVEEKGSGMPTGKV